MTRKRSYTHLSKSRFLALGEFDKGALSAQALGERMWGTHKMALVNAKAIVRELLLGEFIESAFGGEVYRATPKAKSILENPPWICRYCSLDTSDSFRRLWSFPCMRCGTGHSVCRFCRKYLLKASGEFPYSIKLRGCPDNVEVPKRPEPRQKPKAEKATRPWATQEYLFE